MLKASGLTKTYGSLQVLKRVDLEVEKGSIVAIMGASGAGKSTLLHILGSLDVPDGGKVEINGTDVFAQPTQLLAEFRNKNMGFVFQFHNLLPEFTALENVMIPGLIGKMDAGKAKKRGEELLGLLNLKHRINHKPSELSGGEQQRVAVARALINSPVIVFADEPSGNLDSKNADELHALFFQLRKDFGQTFIIVTHNAEFAAMADRKLEIKDGVMMA
ncbi:MAG: ABC transporter ATP-binding protein [Bacteroidetes bacterium]|nr:ABC transporter ATP-binding protein [Bacteroidota bacterium]MBS1541773.1 ABC transporter ATP-binding protein [Bacteroidota bacterium]